MGSSLILLPILDLLRALIKKPQPFNPPPSPLSQADEIYAFGIGRFGNSCSMHLLRAQFCFFYHEHKTVALSHLTRAESRAPSLDEAFSIYLLRKSAHESMSGADGNDIIACACMLCNDGRILVLS